MESKFDDDGIYFNDMVSGNVLELTLVNPQDDSQFEYIVFPLANYYYLWFWSSDAHSGNAGEHVLIPKDKAEAAYRRYIAPIEFYSLVNYSCKKPDHDLHERLNAEVESILQTKCFVSSKTKVTYKMYED